MKKYWFLLLAALLGGATCIFAKDTLATWKAPAGVALNSDFTVKVRLQDGVWHTLSSYLIKVDEVRDTRHYVENASMAIFLGKNYLGQSDEGAKNDDDGGVTIVDDY